MYRWARQALIRRGRSVPHLACGVCWLLDEVAGQHGQSRFLWPRVIDQPGSDVRTRAGVTGEPYETITALAASGQSERKVAGIHDR